MNFPIDQVWVETDAMDEPVTKRIIEKFGSTEIVTGPLIQRELPKVMLAPDPLRKGKRILRLMRYRGNIVRPCPGTRSYLCCGLEILHIGQGCPMDCTYCALQAYLNSPFLDLFVNFDDIYRELGDHLEKTPDRFHRICTGEFTDSLALDPFTNLAQGLVSFFSQARNASLELKTKTDNIAPLLEVDPRGRTVVSFSVNAETVILREEHSSCSLKRRLRAATRLQERGYWLGFHFDPIIPYPNFERDYEKTIREIATTVHPGAIAWISMGVLRFVPELKNIVLARFGPRPCFYDAFARGLDGKCRLHARRRIEVYRKISDYIWQHLPGVKLYFCMESEYVWRESLGIEMRDNAQLADYLNEAVHCDTCP